MCAIMLPLSHWGRAHKVRSYISRAGKCGSAAHPSYMSSLDKTGLSKTVRGRSNLSELTKG